MMEKRYRHSTSMSSLFYTSIAQDFTYKGDDWWRWWVWIEGSAEELDSTFYIKSLRLSGNHIINLFNGPFHLLLGDDQWWGETNDIVMGIFAE